MKNRAIYILHVVMDGLLDSMTIIIAFMAMCFGAGEKEAGAIISVQTLVHTVIGLYTAYLTRRLGLLKTLCATIALYGAGFFAGGFASSIYIAGAFFVIGSAGYGVFHNAALAHLSYVTPKNTVGKILGDFTAIGDLGRMPFAVLAGGVAALTFLDVPGWRFVCLFVGLFSMLASLVFYLCHQEQRDEAGALLPEKSTQSAYPDFRILLNARHSLSMIASVLDALGSNQIFAFLPFLLLSKGMDPKVIAPFAVAFTFGSFFGKVVFGRLVGIFNNKLVFVISELVMALLIFVLLEASRWEMVLASALSLGVVSKGTVPVIQTIISQSAKEKHDYDNVFAINGFLRGLSNMLAPICVGLIASYFGVNTSFLLMAGVVVLAVVPVLCLATIPPAAVKA